MTFIYILMDAIELGLIWAPLALGVFISFRVLDFADLTVEGTIVLGTAVTAALMINGNGFFSNYVVALIIAILIGAAAGMITGFLHTKLKIPAILAGIISMTALYSINLMIMKAPSLNLKDIQTIYYPLDQLFSNVLVIKNVTLQKFISKTLTSLTVVSIFTVGMYWFFGTELGMAIRAVGMNEQMAKSQGINTDKMIVIGLAISNALIALTGSLYVQNFKTANMDIGRGTIIVGLASIILGEAIIGTKSFKRWLIAIISGTIIFQFLIGVAINLGFSPNNLKLLQAILIALVLANPIIKKTILRYKNNRGVKNA